MGYEIQIEVDEDYVGQVNAGALEAVAAAALLHVGIADADVTLVITTDEEVQALNQEYRGVDAPTDVLSFSAQEGDELILDAPDELKELMERSLGDIVIALPYAIHQAARFGNSVDGELALLTVHGLLHLLGHDHATAEGEAEMWALQEEILRPLGHGGQSFRAHEG